MQKHKYVKKPLIDQITKKKWDLLFDAPLRKTMNW